MMRSGCDYGKLDELYARPSPRANHLATLFYQDSHRSVPCHARGRAGAGQVKTGILWWWRGCSTFAVAVYLPVK